MVISNSLLVIISPLFMLNLNLEVPSLKSRLQFRVKFTLIQLLLLLLTLLNHKRLQELRMLLSMVLDLDLLTPLSHSHKQ